MAEPTEDSFGNDPLGLRLLLEEALAQPELDAFDSGGVIGDVECKAAYRVAIALGECRLFGVDAGEYDGTLSPVMASAAAQESRRVLDDWRTAAERLGEDFDSASDSIEAEGLCCDMLACRMQAWAVFEALRESFLAAANDRDVCAVEITHEVGAVSDAIEAFDTALMPEVSLLSVATGTELLNNWRARLAEKHKANLPWWLDGRLEKAAERSLDETVRSLPHWRIRRERDSLSLTRLETWKRVRAAWFMPERAAAASEKPLEFYRLRWRSPDRKFEAWFDRGVFEKGDVTMRFFDVATGDAAITLKGTVVAVSAATSTIEERGVAHFVPNEFFKDEEPPDLIVGEGPWEPAPIDS